MNEQPSDWIKLMVKYKGKCKECGKEISFGEYALWSKASKTIKHIRCNMQDKSESSITILSCFICGGPAGCVNCIYEPNCDRTTVSQACICIDCFKSPNAYENYQQQFITNL
jgi:hypothetical protein